MATVILQVVGASLGGGLFGALGSAIGSAAGAIGGYLVDRTLIQSTQRLEGPRLDAMRPFTAEEGAVLPRVYGTARVGGTMIWATRFEETRTTERQGGKGGPRVTTSSYFGNVAFAICQGPIAGVRRVWADGRELDLDEITMRVYRGDEDQPPDPLIAARQEPGAAPAYRGTAYAVFERLPLDDYGNRYPQLQFEVMRPASGIADRVRAVALIPGSTEFGLSTRAIRRQVGPGETVLVNRHTRAAETDLIASLDELQALCPALEHVALVVSWFGDDLRAGECRVRPGVTDREAPGIAEPWAVSGTPRATAYAVSRHAGNPAYGGTPSDRTVLEAIAELKSRGLGVTLYPFVLMDVPADNALADPYGAERQAAYPWRGRITAMPAPGEPESSDRTAAARTQVEAFCGNAAPAEFVATAGGVTFTGSASDWGYRRLVLHYARLAQMSGGVDAFLIGSELRGLTTLRDETDAYPFVEALGALAQDVRAILGPDPKITYGADWSEYFGHHPQDGSGDVRFHLDPLWANPAIDAVGIDNYMPLSDWRDEDFGGGNPDGFEGPYDAAGLRAAIAGGEGFDWYYPDEAARLARERAPITDGAYGKPWVFRYKDLVAWWSNPHHDRVGGVELAEPTAWVPRSKPIWMTELGCPASDKAPNQPNVFPDPKSGEGALPRFSDGGRSDTAQERFLAAHADHWTAVPSDRNPPSDLFDGAMVATDRIYLWAWDARPFPEFPLRTDVWSDGPNWLIGHWLNGRLSGASARGTIDAILAEHGIESADTGKVDGFLHGYVVAGPTTARSALEPLLEALGIGCFEDGTTLAFFSGENRKAVEIQLSELVQPEDGPAIERTRADPADDAGELEIAFRDPFADHQQASARAAIPAPRSANAERIALPATVEPGVAQAWAQEALVRRIAGRDTVAFALPPGHRDVAAGNVVAIDGLPGRYRVEELEDGLFRRVTARRIAPGARVPARVSLPAPLRLAPSFAGPPDAVLMDLPMPPTGGVPADQLRAAARAIPWRTQVVLASPSLAGFEQRAALDAPATMGVLVSALAGACSGRFMRDQAIEVTLSGGALSSVPAELLLNGANIAALRSASGAWEIVQFAEAEEVAPGRWRLGRLLRGQGGTEDAMQSGAEPGAAFVLLDGAVRPAGLRGGETGLDIRWRIGPVGAEASAERFSETVAAGGMRALMPLSPVHLRAERHAEGGIVFGWIRRGRVDADGWLGPDIPLGEDREAYLAELLVDGVPVRSAEVPAAQWALAAADLEPDLSALPLSVTLRVRQLSGAIGPGIPATRDFHL
jgi:hypothetical protein